MQLAYELQLGPEEFKAWSQNLGHDGILITFSSYGQVSSQRQADLMRGMGNKDAQAMALTDAEVKQLAAMLAAEMRAS